LRSNRHKVRNAKNVPTGGIVESFNLIKANFEETDTSNRWQLVPDLQGLGGHYQLQLENLDLALTSFFYFVLPCRKRLEDGQPQGVGSGPLQT
jgi:hypothetical protein